MTIVELATVVIIVGAVAAMTLKGTVLIDIARSFIARYEIQMYQSRVQLYAGQYKYLPGDDPKAAKRYGHPEASTVAFGSVFTAVGNDKIDGLFLDVDSPNGEQFMAWRDMRFAKMLNGDPALEGVAAMPTNPFGGVYGFDQGNLGQTRGSLCLNKVPGSAAQRIDESLDDGVIDKGDVVAIVQPDHSDAKGHFDAPDSKPYDVEKEYIICVALPS